MITVVCNNCGASLNVEPTLMRSNEVICPRCRGRVVVNVPRQAEQPTVLIHPGQPQGAPTQVAPAPASQQTHIGGPKPEVKGPIGGMRPTPSGATQIISPEMMAFNGLGGLYVAETGEYAPLKEGSNVVGRKARTGDADIKISDDKFMSRRHLQIDVSRDAFGRYVHRLIEINSTNILKLNGQPVERGKLLIMRIGDVLTLGKTDVKFVAHDPRMPG